MTFGSSGGSSTAAAVDAIRLQFLEVCLRLASLLPLRAVELLRPSVATAFPMGFRAGLTAVVVPFGFRPVVGNLLFLL